MITGSMMASTYHSAPTLFYPPAPSTEYFPATGAHCVSYSPSPEPQPLARPPPTQLRSRKRSRDQTEEDDREAAFNESNLMDTNDGSPEPEPIYGEGMILINPKTGQPVGNGASSNTGTWCEERVDEERRASVAAMEQMKRNQEEMAIAANRPSKAQRIDLTNIASARRSGSPSTLPGLIAPTPITPITPLSPVIDEAAMMLGVGWRKVDGSGDVALVGASKGWARYIDNHFAGLSNATILAKSSGKEAFLVKAHDGNFGAEGVFLFSESLEQGRLLAYDVQTAVGNLQEGVFAGPLMGARKSASPEPVQLPTPAEVAMEM